MNRLADKCVWLTGASQGIGRALALELASRGARVALTSRNEANLNQVRDELKRVGSDCLLMPGDVTDAKRMHEIALEIERRFGRIDILIANAGTHIFTKPESFDANEYMQLMALNYGGMLNCIEAALPGMLRSGSGQVVGAASLAGYRGLPRAAAYGASKAAMINFLESLRFHTALSNVQVTIINPGFVKTPLTDKNDFHMPFLVAPERAARIMCDGIARRKDVVAFPIPFSWLIALMRVIPYALYKRIMARAWKR